MTTEFSRADYERKIAALLAKAEDASLSQAEAEAFSRKAEELMIRWGVDEAVLAAVRTNGKTTVEPIVRYEFGDMGSTMQPANVRLVWLIAQGLGLRSYVHHHGNVQTVFVVGFESDVHRAQLLVASLRLQATTALGLWWRGKDPADPRIVDRKFWMNRGDQTAARRQFVISFGVAVKNRLEAMRITVVAEKGTGAELAVRDRGSLVDAWMDENVGKLRSGRAIRGSYDGAAAGRAAGGRASLDSPAVRGGRKSVGR